MVPITMDTEELGAVTKWQIPSLKKITCCADNLSYQLIPWTGKVFLFQELRAGQPLRNCLPSRASSTGRKQGPSERDPKDTFSFEIGKVRQWGRERCKAYTHIKKRWYQPSRWLGFCSHWKRPTQWDVLSRSVCKATHFNEEEKNQNVHLYLFHLRKN